MPSVLMKHGPIEAVRQCQGRGSRTRPSVLMKHGPIEAFRDVGRVGKGLLAFRADEARPH